MTKLILFLVVMLTMLFSGTFTLEGKPSGCAVSGLVSANAGHKSVTLLAVNYRHNKTFYHLAVR